jgi:rhodanese-related sulfurtransferase
MAHMSTGKWPAVVWLCFCLVVSVVADSSTQTVTDPPVKHVNPNEAQKLIAEKKVIVLDLRTPGEFKAAHITGATNIDFLASDFETRIDQLDTNKTYLVHCASGGRSTHSLPVFHKHHFELLYHLDGGIKAWEKAGLPVEK